MDISILDKYDYLNILNQEHSEEFEVTADAINCYSRFFSIYSEEKGWEKNLYASHRNQMSSSGCWLHNSKKCTIDIAGDILTSAKAFSGLEDIQPDLFMLFKRLYHTIGNCIPWPEGGNLGGRPWETGGSPDNYYRKIMACYKIMTKTSQYDTSCVSCKISKKQTLGGLCYSSIQYWLDEIWKGNTWEDFVRINYLEDMVDENLIPIPFVVGGEKIDKDNSQLITDTYLQSIKMIICRGYRITHNGELDMTVINRIYKELGFDEVGPKS